ncbi:hypothetical protein NC652_037806 [Populus alba x Populus x berolinensis]|nr:hypothetical protein NC652_037806 [Populus alba x Populus x berolinensis]
MGYDSDWALANGENLSNGYSNFPDLDPLEVKAEECQWSFESSYDQHSFMPQSYSNLDNVAKEAAADLYNNADNTQRSFPSPPVATESSLNEESNFKDGRYSAEERKERFSLNV